MPETIEFQSLRADWFANFMARALQRQLRSRKPLLLFKGFPRHWLPLFEWAGAPWKGSIEPRIYVPLFSGRSEPEIVSEIARARANGQLRLLAEVAASTEIVLCETLQRMDGRLAPTSPSEGERHEIRLTTWHSYNRPDVRAFDAIIAGFRQTKAGVLFIPCAKARPYHRSQSHRRLMSTARAAGLELDQLDTIVITSIGPVPEAYWEHNFVLRYDTGVRDIYRLMLQLKTLLKHTSYVEAWDLMPLLPYSDIIRLLHLEGLLPMPKRLESIRRRNIPVYRPSKSHPLEHGIR
jgi:uncharacterized protein DUF5591